jgi:hypothetical protein
MSIQTLLAHLCRNVVALRGATASVLRLILRRAITEYASPGLVGEKEQKHKTSHQRPRSGPQESGSKENEMTVLPTGLAASSKRLFASATQNVSRSSQQAFYP